jgi:hypothetical protein
MKDCPNCGINTTLSVCDFCSYPMNADQKETTRFIAKQSITKVTITDSQRISKIAGQLMSVLAGLQIVLLLFLVFKYPLSIVFISLLFPIAYLILGLLAIRIPIPGISIAIVLYLIEKYFLYATGYTPGFLGVVFSLAFLAVLIIGLVNGVKYQILKKNHPYLYAQITGGQNVSNKDIID